MNKWLFSVTAKAEKRFFSVMNVDAEAAEQAFRSWVADQGIHGSIASEGRADITFENQVLYQSSEILEVHSSFRATVVCEV